MYIKLNYFSSMEKFNIANLPTKIHKLEKFSKEMNANVWIKRDDQTGSEISGNKIRKLEYLAKDAIAKGYDMLITCGGIQSNHCRATVATATMFGLKSAVLLRISDTPPVVGNYFIDKLLGADVKFCTREEYSKSRGQSVNIAVPVPQNKISTSIVGLPKWMFAHTENCATEEEFWAWGDSASQKPVSFVPKLYITSSLKHCKHNPEK